MSINIFFLYLSHQSCPGWSTISISLTCQKNLLYLNLCLDWATQKWSKFIILGFYSYQSIPGKRWFFKNLYLPQIWMSILLFTFNMLPLASYQVGRSLNLPTINIWDQKIFCLGWWRYPVHCRMVNSSPGLYLLGTSSTVPIMNQKCLQALPNVGGGRQGQNHPPLRTSELK